MDNRGLDAPAPAVPAVAAERDVPEVASARRYLRDALPSIYRTPDSFAMRLLYALERVLDPRVAILDSLWAYLDPRLAPDAMVEEMARWLGLELGGAPAGGPRRELLTHAGELARRRGTRAGLQRVLQTAFPHLRLRVEDHGAVIVDTAQDAPTIARSPGVVVHCPVPLSPSERAAVEGTIERELPLHVEGRLVDALDRRERAR